MKRKTVWMIAACLLLCLVASSVIYTRPWTIEERYDALDLSKCTKIEGTWAYSEERLNVGETQNFELTPGDENFDKLVELMQNTEFQSQLTNLLPRGKGAVNYHTPEAGDFAWDIRFVFDEPVLLADGHSAKGTLLNVHNFYGRVTVAWPTEDEVLCKVSDHEAWIEGVFHLISAQEG